MFVVYIMKNSDLNNSINVNIEDEEDPWKDYSLNMQNSLYCNEKENEKGFHFIKIHSCKKKRKSI